jgi:hypothetical protein
MSTSSVLRICLASSVVVGVATANAQNKAADAGAAAATSPAAAAEPVHAPAPELVNFMKDMLGTWTCATTFMPGAFGPGSPEQKATAKVKFSKEPKLAGFFYRGEYAIPKSKEMPTPMSGIFYLGYDSGFKQIITVGVDSMGGASMGTGPLTETTATWTGDSYMMGKKVKVRETMTKTGPKQLTHLFETDTGKGFQKVGEDICKK